LGALGTRDFAQARFGNFMDREQALTIYEKTYQFLKRTLTLFAGA
jgi:hypothetical protein